MKEFETEIFDIKGQYAGRWLLAETEHQLVALRRLPDLITNSEREILTQKESDENASST